MNGVYMAMLAKDTASPLLPSDGQADAPKKDDKAAAPASIKVDADGIYGRIIKLPLRPGMYRNFYCDGKKLYYGSGRDTKAFDFKTQKEETVAEGASFSITPGSKKALFSKRGQMFVCDFPAAKANMKNAVSLKDMVAHVNYKEEWAQIYDEVWRAYRDGFYLENMHGIDWKAIKKKYEV